MSKGLRCTGLRSQPTSAFLTLLRLLHRCCWLLLLSCCLRRPTGWVGGGVDTLLLRLLWLLAVGWGHRVQHTRLTTRLQQRTCRAQTPQHHDGSNQYCQKGEASQSLCHIKHASSMTGISLHKCNANLYDASRLQHSVAAVCMRCVWFPPSPPLPGRALADRNMLQLIQGKKPPHSACNTGQLLSLLACMMRLLRPWCALVMPLCSLHDCQCCSAAFCRLPTHLGTCAETCPL